MQGCRLSAKDLACRRGSRILFAGLTLDLKSGAALHIAAPNGVGKSSLLRILGGLARPEAGQVSANAAIGLLDDRLALDEHQPLRKALGFWCKMDGCAPDTHTDLLGLSDLLDVPVRYLSTGQRKRAALARLIDQRAPIWLLDEPLNGLDADGIALLEALASDHCAHGGIAVVASHQRFSVAGLEHLPLAEYVP